jgi:phage terminase large subunit
VHRLGFNIKPASKGQDSIRNSIDILHRFNIQVTKTSTNLIKELRNYTWDTDRTGASLGVPIDKYNHAIDAVRYVALNKLSQSAGGKYVIM